MQKRKIKSIGDTFEALSPFLVSIEINNDNLKPFLTLIFPKNWEIDDINYVKISERERASVYIYQSDGENGVDSIISTTIGLIDFNLKLEEKQKKIEQLIKKKQDKLNREIEKLKQELGQKLELIAAQPIIEEEPTQKVEPEMELIDYVEHETLPYIPPYIQQDDSSHFGGIQLVQDIQAQPEGFEDDQQERY